MALDMFDTAVVQEGYLYELNKGTIEVSEVPNLSHLAQFQEIRNQLVLYQAKNPDSIHSITGSNESKVLLAADQSERHPDVSVYLTAPPDSKDVWGKWIPAIVVEIVSQSSTKRDYEEKPLEYLAFGIDEYWIVDRRKQLLTAMSRWRGQWQTKTYKSANKIVTPLLPGFSLDLKRVFAAAK